MQYMICPNFIFFNAESAEIRKMRNADFLKSFRHFRSSVISVLKKIFVEEIFVGLGGFFVENCGVYFADQMCANKLCEINL
jgi:hypothetical protein